MSAPQNKSDKPLTPSKAWQPLTPRGIAAFASASFMRLFSVQLIVAAIVAMAVIWFLRMAWFPVVTEAAQRLPETGAIRGGELDFGGPSPARLAENARLAIIADVVGAGTMGHAADLEITFEKNQIVVCGALGCQSRPYDRRFIVGFNRSEVEAAWGAWQWPIIAIVTIVTFVSLMAMWWALALVYLPLTKILAFYADRRITWGGAWRLSAAALLPGALIVAAGLLLYAFGTIDLFRLVLAFLLHLFAGLVFVMTSPFFLPAVPISKNGKNPFGAPRSEISASGAKKLARRRSPFSAGRDD